jgi:hypothetical protein
MIKTVTDLSHELSDENCNTVLVSPVIAAIGLIYMIYEFVEHHPDGFVCDEYFTRFVGYEGQPDALKKSLLLVGILVEKDGALFVRTESARRAQESASCAHGCASSAH